MPHYVIHTVGQYRLVGHVGHFLQIILSTSREMVIHDNLCCTSSHNDTHSMEELVPGHYRALLRQILCISKSTRTARYNAHFQQWIRVFQEPPHCGMSCLVVSNNITLLLGKHLVLLLQASDNLVNRSLKVVHIDAGCLLPRSNKSCFIAHIRNISSREARRESCQSLRVGFCILHECEFPHVNQEDFLAPLNIWISHFNLPIETSWTQQSIIQYVLSVGRSEDNDICTRVESIHLYEQLIQSIFTLVISAT
mmetsp:Transcript_10069/g.37549  ORF Transcript_10069/g.37549 Transcript_10069/m.37549 type:complete len:252 (-) Transcript_10069:1649-2404(-)